MSKMSIVDIISTVNSKVLPHMRKNNFKAATIADVAATFASKDAFVAHFGDKVIDAVDVASDILWNVTAAANDDMTTITRTIVTMVKDPGGVDLIIH